MASEHRYALKLIGIAAAAAAAVIIACETDISPVGPVDSVSQLVVSPHTVTLQPGEVQAFMAVGFTAAGDTAQINVTWSVTGGNLVDTSSAGGRHYGDYEGTSCGGFKVAATSHPGEKSDTASVAVVCPPPAVASVDVTPPSASVQAGQTVQLTATPKDANGAPLSGRTVTWSSSNTSIAAVSTSGLVSGVTPGSVTISATSEGKSGTAAITVTSSGGAPFGHVFIVVEENTNYASVIGSSAMPYLSSLAQQYGLATQYYANTHPSIGNYFMMTVGDIFTNDDSYGGTVSEDNVVRQLLKAGKTWKSYAEDLPSVGYHTPGETGNYASRHNPFSYLTDVVNDPVQLNNLVPFTQFPTDLANGALPNYSFIVPNLCNDAHDCSLGTADSWLQANIDPLIKSATFQQDGLLIILFDESDSDHTNGGGRVVWVVVSPKAKRGYQSTTFYQHQSTLRLTLKALGVTAFPNAAASAPDMDEFFTP